MAHDFGDDDAVMAVRSTMQTVNGFGRNIQRGGVAEGGVGHGHVVINGLGQSDDVEAGLVKAQRILLRSAAAEADEAIETPFFVIAHNCFGHIARAAVNDHAMRFIAAGAEDGAADGKDARESGAVEPEPIVFHEAPETVAKADDFHAIEAKARFANATNGSVEAGAVSAGSENADAFDFRYFGHAASELKPPGKFCRAEVL